MDIKKVALVLQGGAVRGVFTAGVLDVLLENDLHFQYISAVSAGALNALNYLSQQVGRSKSLFIDYMSDKKFVNAKFLVTKKTLFNFNYLFDEIARKELPFDFETYDQNKAKLFVATTSCLTGKANYHEKNSEKDFLTAVAASASLPFFSAPIIINNQPYMDGGLATPIPFKKALEDGFEKVVVITTRDITYRKDETKRQKEKALKLLYGKYPKFIETTLRYPKTYNEEAELLEELENNKVAFVIRPEDPILLKRTEKNKEELSKVYDCGKKVGRDILEELKKFISENE